MGLDVTESGEPVAIDGGAFEIQLFGGFLHALGNFLAHGLALAGQEQLGFLDQFGIALG